MRTIVITTFFAFLAANAFAQQPEADKATAQIHQGTVKIGIGIGLSIAGVALLTTPTNPSSARNRIDGPASAMVAGGFGFIAWGAKERWQAVHPQTTVGVMVGRSRGIQIHRVW